jgi:hypothetical protein
MQVVLKFCQRDGRYIFIHNRISLSFLYSFFMLN